MDGPAGRTGAPSGSRDGAPAPTGPAARASARPPGSTALLLAVFALLYVGCSGPEASAVPDAGEGTREPAAALDADGAEPGAVVAAAGRLDAATDTLSVAILVRRDTATVFSDGPARLVAAGSGETVARAGAYEPFHFLVAGGGATAWGPWGELETSAERLRVVPRSDDAVVFVDGRPYRGRAEVVHQPDGTLVVAARVERETYLASVVSSELGDEGLRAFEAAKAQAVAARTYAVAFAERGARDSLGVDLVADPEVDQSYPGRLAAREAGRRAVEETSGRVLAHDGRLATAYYHSTCGGRTARPEEIWEEEPRPYLRSLVDAPGGDAEARDYCAASPHHRWSREWMRRELDEAVRPAAARAAGLDPAELGAMRSVEATGRTEHGRVTELTVVAERAAGAEGSPPQAGGDTAANRSVPEAPAAADTLRFGTREIPGVLVSPAGEALRSTWFEVVEPPEEDGLALEGRGSGHGVGMCQWGAVERARRGAGWREILGTYYPGTEVARLEDVGRGG